MPAANPLLLPNGGGFPNSTSSTYPCRASPRPPHPSAAASLPALLQMVAQHRQHLEHQLLLQHRLHCRSRHCFMYTIAFAITITYSTNYRTDHTGHLHWHPPGHLNWILCKKRGTHFHDKYYFHCRTELLLLCPYAHQQGGGGGGARVYHSLVDPLPAGGCVRKPFKPNKHMKDKKYAI